mgnify:CR=1 FL=1|tara:strand:+ start:574 stop:1911 length:1338 start_codon:yes stop_codon:yes gene_type:complete
MSRSREDKAADVLLLAELTGRGIKWDDFAQKSIESENVNTPDELSESWNSYASKIRYLMPRSAAGWTAEFQKVLTSSHSMRVKKVSMDRKNIMRGGHGVCMACGRKEKNCNVAVDFAGNFNSTEFVSDVKNLTPGYITFMKDYDKVFAKSFLKCPERQFSLAEQDKGTYILGETCLRKAKIMFLLQTTMLERSYDAEHEIRMAEETSIGYTVDDKSIDAFIKQLDIIELAIADEKRFIPRIPNDQSYWDILDEGRSIASNADADESARLTYERAKRELGSMAEEKRDNEVEEEEEEEGEEEEEEDDEEEDGSTSEDESPPKRRRLRRSSAATVVSDEDEDEPVEKSTGTKRGKGTETHLSGSETSQNNRPMSSRSVPPSIQDFAGRQRADGNLPSRQASLLALMDLQMRLGRKGDFQDCAICSNAILTLQELIAKVEELRHTVGI